MSHHHTPAHVRKRRAERRATLKRLGYESYPAYLRSPHWARKRAEYHASDLTQACVLCASPDDVDLHHKTYERIGNEVLADLEPLCRRCHVALHTLERRGDTTLDPADLADQERAAANSAARAPNIEQAAQHFDESRDQPDRWFAAWNAILDQHLQRLIEHGDASHEDMRPYADSIRRRVAAAQKRLHRARLPSRIA